MAETRQKILPTVIYRIFQIKFQQIHLISVSCHCKCCIFKMCQNVAAISINSQFHEFFNSNFGGLVRLVALEVASAASPAQQPPPKMTGSISKCSCSFRSLSKIVRKMGSHTAVPHVEKSATKISSPKVISRIFPCKILHIQIPSPVAWALNSKFVKPLQAQVWSHNFTTF